MNIKGLKEKDIKTVNLLIRRSIRTLARVKLGSLNG